MIMPVAPAQAAGAFSRIVDLGDEIALDHENGFNTDNLLEELLEASHAWVALKWEAGVYG